MKTKFASLLSALLIAISGITLVGCDFGAMGTKAPVRDYNADIQVVAPENIPTEDFVMEEDKTYYTSPGFSLWMEVNGAFLEMNYFYLDGNKRVYDNLYFYKDDYFYMITDDVQYLYASLADSADFEYAEEERQSGEDIQINIKKAGIYKLIFDTDTLKFDIEYKAEIETPVYYTIKKCQIYTITKEWVDMSVNPDNTDEFVIKNFDIGLNEAVSFYDTTHTSFYKTTIDASCAEKYASDYYRTTMVNVGGTYNVYINSKTYVVRFELLNPDTATYSCVYYDGKDFITLEPYDVEVPYLFRQKIVVTTQYTTDLPKFHTEKYKTYDLTVVDTTDVLMGSGSSYYFKQPGTYYVIINLKTFEITAELLPE